MSSGGVEPEAGWKARARDAIRYWEPRRVVYNLVLAAIVVAWIVATWPHLRPSLRPSAFLQLGVLALFANVCYSAAYIVEVSAHRSPWFGAWRAHRWVVWLAGLVLAIVLANYWIVDQIFPSVV